MHTTQKVEDPASSLRASTLLNLLKTEKNIIQKMDIMITSQKFVFGACSYRAWLFGCTCKEKTEKDFHCQSLLLLFIGGCIWYTFESSVFYEQQGSVGRAWSSQNVSLPRTACSRPGCWQGANDDELSTGWLSIKTLEGNLLAYAEVPKCWHRTKILWRRSVTSTSSLQTYHHMTRDKCGWLSIYRGSRSAPEYGIWEQGLHMRTVKEGYAPTSDNALELATQG